MSELVKALLRMRSGSTTLALVAFVISLNLHRRHLNASQRAMIALQILPMLEEEAKERQREAGTLYGEGHPKNQEGSPISDYPLGSPLSRQAASQAAALVGVGRSQVYEAKRLVQDDPEIAQRIREGGISINAAQRQHELTYAIASLNIGAAMQRGA